MFILGLTGSLGMGKTTTAKFFAEEGVPVHDADAAVHALYQGEAVAAIEAAFPGVTAGGKVDRDKLSAHLLTAPGDFARLEGIVHPLVRKAEEAFLARAQKNGARIALLDIPLLYETGGDKRCDAVVVVTAPAATQRARAFERPGMSDERFAAIAGKQMPDAEKRKRADFLVDTSKGMDAAHAQVRDILARVAKMPPRRGA